MEKVLQEMKTEEAAAAEAMLEENPSLQELSACLQQGRTKAFSYHATATRCSLTKALHESSVRPQGPVQVRHYREPVPVLGVRARFWNINQVSIFNFSKNWESAAAAHSVLSRKWQARSGVSNIAV